MPSQCCSSTSLQSKVLQHPPTVIEDTSKTDSFGRRRHTDPMQGQKRNPPIFSLCAPLGHRQDSTFCTSKAAGRLFRRHYIARSFSTFHDLLVLIEWWEGRLQMGDRGSLPKRTLSELMGQFGISCRRKKHARIWC